MSKVFLIIFFGFVLSQQVIANCEYVDLEQYTESGVGLCLRGSTKYYAKELNISESTNGQYPSFTIYNPNTYRMKVFLNYTVQGALYPEEFYGVVLGGNDSYVANHICYAEEGIGDCSIDSSRITYFITEPRNMDICLTEIPKFRTICNKSCLSDNDCFTGICNIAGFCGSRKVVPCAENETNCQDSACLRPGVKHGGESYLCKFECSSGKGEDGVCKENDGVPCQKDLDCLSGICNAAKMCGSNITCAAGTENCRDQGCFSPGTKKYHEAYLCSWECKSDRGFYGVCQMSTHTLIGIATLLFFVGAIYVYYFAFYKRRKEERFRKEVEGKRMEEEQTLYHTQTKRKKMEDEIISYSDKLQEMQIELYNLTKKKNKIHQKIKNARGHARQVYEQTYARISAELENLEQMETKLQMSSRDYYLKKYKERYGEKIYVPEGGNYIRFKTGMKEYLHIYIYKSHYDEIPQGHQVHHIDGNSFNDEIWNLIAVPNSCSREPQKIRHGRISSWMSGYEELKRIGLDQEIFMRHQFVEEHYKEEIKVRK
jgi:hypothetical protein